MLKQIRNTNANKENVKFTSNMDIEEYYHMKRKAR